MAAPNFDMILRQARRLPSNERRVLAERLLQPEAPDEQAALVAVHRFGEPTQQRFDELMDRHTDDVLSAAEHAELRGLVERYEKMLLRNTRALLRVTSPELFAASGSPVQRRVTAALRRKRAQSGNGRQR